MMTDQHNYRTLGCYRDYLISKGQTEQAFVWGPGVAVETPNLDRLATEGVLFTNFHTTSPLCTPNRGSFLSGLYPATNGADKNDAAMNEDVVTFAEVLREKRDYNTAYFGKWHLNGKKKPAWGEDSNFYDFGFKDIKHLFNKGHWKFIEEQQNGKMQAYTYADGKRKFKGKEDKHFTTDYLFDRGIEFMEKSRQQGEPFLTFLSIPDPHAPKDVRPPYDTMFNHFTFQLPFTARTAARRAPASPGWNDHDYLSVPLDDTEDYLDDVEKRTFYQESLRSYFGMVKCIDDNIGKLFSYLDSAGIDDDTIIVFTSDHGDMLAEHGKFNKNTPFRTSAGVPFMIRSPNKIAAGKIVETAYSSVDFAPSILSVLGVTDTNVDFQGIDFSEELLNNDIVPTKDVIRYVFQSGKKGNWAAAVMKQYKLVVSLNSEPWLFDLDQDPYEIVNYIDDKSIPIDVKQKLQDGLYNAMIEFEIPLQTSAKWGSIYFNPPVCFDSKDRLPTEELAGLCTDVGKSIPISETCSIEKFQNHCPVTCGTCCADSDGPLWSKGDLLTCEELSNIGRCNGKSQTFCNISCNQCSA
jgi:arylsulfatase A-like enzyme